MTVVISPKSLNQVGGVLHKNFDAGIDSRHDLVIAIRRRIQGICRMYNDDRLRYCKRIVRAGLGTDHLLKPQVRIPTRRIGSVYGGWFVADDPLGSAKNPVVLSFGLGDDISFDEGMIQTYGASVYGFDPTPHSLEWIATHGKPSCMQVVPVGIAASDGEQTFLLPENEGRGNFSSKATLGMAINCKVMRYGSILAMLELRHVDVLKLDVEGSEYEVIPDILKASILPNQLLVEFHHRIHNIHVAGTRKSVRMIKQAGFSLFAVSPGGQELSFIRN